MILWPKIIQSSIQDRNELKCQNEVSQKEKLHKNKGTF